MQIPERLASSRFVTTVLPPDVSRFNNNAYSPMQASWFDPCRDRVLPLPLDRSNKHETFDDIQRLAHRRRQHPPTHITTSINQRSTSPDMPRKDSVHSQPDAHKLRPILSTHASANPVLPRADRSPFDSTKHQLLKRPASDLGLDNSYEHHDRARRGWSAGEVSPRTTVTHSRGDYKSQLPPTPPSDRLFFPRLSIPHLLGPQTPPHRLSHSTHNPPARTPFLDRPAPRRADASLSPRPNTDHPADHPAPNTTVMPSHTANRVKYKGVCRTAQGDFYTYEDGSLVPTHVDGEPVNPAWGLTKANRPRKRLPKACRACRDEKSRCEPTRSGCMRCDVTGRTCAS